MAKRKFNQDFIKYGFTSFSDRGEEKGQWIICYCVLSNESLQPSKLQNHLEKNHPGLKDKDKDFIFFVNDQDMKSQAKQKKL